MKKLALIVLILLFGCGSGGSNSIPVSSEPVIENPDNPGAQSLVWGQSKWGEGRWE